MFPVISALGRQRKEDHEFKVILCYITNFGVAWAYLVPVSKKKKISVEEKAQTDTKNRTHENRGMNWDGAQQATGCFKWPESLDSREDT